MARNINNNINVSRWNKSNCTHVNIWLSSTLLAGYKIQFVHVTLIFLPPFGTLILLSLSTTCHEADSSHSTRCQTQRSLLKPSPMFEVQGNKTIESVYLVGILLFIVSCTQISEDTLLEYGRESFT